MGNIYPHGIQIPPHSTALYSEILQIYIVFLVLAFIVLALNDLIQEHFHMKYQLIAFTKLCFHLYHKITLRDIT